MLKAAEEPLYEGCTMSLLSVATRVTNIKCEHNIPHRAIEAFSLLIKDLCPDNSNMTETFYETKKLLNGLILPHIKIDICQKGCMLFWKEHIGLNECLICKENQYKNKRANGKSSPIMVLTYFPIAPRLQRLYATKSTVKQMRWHAKNHRATGCMSHPSDGEAWKHFDAMYPSFSNEPRNVRLGLSTDGFLLFGKLGKQYSYWLVILTPYNLPPWLCMKKSFMFLSLIIPGLKNPKGKLESWMLLCGQ